MKGTFLVRVNLYALISSCTGTIFKEMVVSDFGISEYVWDRLLIAVKNRPRPLEFRSRKKTDSLFFLQ